MRKRPEALAALLLLALVIIALARAPDPLTDMGASAGPPPGDLSSYPRPENDNGRGLHWFPASVQSPAQVDLYVSQLVDMDIRWIVFLGSPGDFWARDSNPPWTNTILVRSLRQRGIEPVMRLYMHLGSFNRWDVQRTVRYYRELGVSYFQLFNEPNRPNEWIRPSELSPNRYVDYWLSLASIVTAEGGYPGFGALDPQHPNAPDLDFLAEALLHLKAQGRDDVLARTWLAIHNYTGGTPSDYTADREGFARFEAYNEVVVSALGYSLPVIGTEGVLSSADGRWDKAPEETARLQAAWVEEGYRFMERAPAYLFAFSPWLLGNGAGGAQDERWEKSAFFAANGTPQPVVETVGNPVYLLRNGSRHWIGSPEALETLGYELEKLRRLPRQELESIPQGEPIPVMGEGSLIKDKSDPVYLIEGGLRRWIPDVETFEAMRYRWRDVLWVAGWIVQRIPEGDPLPSVLSGASRQSPPEMQGPRQPDMGGGELIAAIQ